MTWVAVGVAGASVVGGAISANASKKAANAQAGAAGAAAAEQGRQYDIARADQAPFMRTGVAANQRLAQLLGLTRGAGSAVSGPISQDQFDADAYLAANPDVAKAGADPYAHYLQFGLNEGRQGYKLGDFQQGAGTTPEDIMAMDPGYQFRMDQGLNATKNAAVARGGLDSGATLKALTRFGQDYASGEFGSIYNRLAGVSGAGQTATNAVQAAGTNAANQTGEALMGAGNARAAGIVGGANAWGNALGGVAGAAQGYQSNQFLQALLKKQQPGYSGYGMQGDYQYG